MFWNKYFIDGWCLGGKNVAWPKYNFQKNKFGDGLWKKKTKVKYEYPNYKRKEFVLLAIFSRYKYKTNI